LYREFYGFGQAMFTQNGSILGSSHCSQLPQLLQKTTLDSKVVKFGSKIIILFCKSKSMTHSVSMLEL